MHDAPRHPLVHGPMLDPRYFRAEPSLGTVEADGRVACGRDRFAFRGGGLPAGTAVRLVMTRHDGLFAVSIAEEEAARADFFARQEERLAAEAAAHRVAADRTRDEASAFNTGLGLPFAWTPACRAHAAGLRPSSTCNGEWAAMVTHVRCDEAVTSGRLRRAAGALLCGADDGRMGYLFEDLDRDGDGRPFGRKATCKACLKVAVRLSTRQPA